MKIVKIIALAREAATSVVMDNDNIAAKSKARDILNNLQSIPFHVIDMDYQDFKYILESCTSFLRNYYISTSDTALMSIFESILFGIMNDCIDTLNRKEVLAKVHWAVWDLAKNVSIFRAQHSMPLLDLLNSDPSGDTLYSFIRFAIKDDVTFLDFFHVLMTYGVLS